MMQTNIFHIIKDPVHGSMQFSQLENAWIKPFIDSENFQRLRYIKQLGLADLIFPGAVHTRFSHSLGCCYVGSQIANKLGLLPKDRQIVVLACLLHDIGHGPFSHTFESLFQDEIRHELWTPMFLEEYKDEGFLESFNQLNMGFELDKTIMDLIERLIMHSSLPKQQLLADIVSSQLDADRLDYLLRDSHFCGVDYGEFDFRWLLHCLTIASKDGQDRLGITAKGIGVVEHYLMARRLMVMNVYQHGKKYGAEYLLQAFLKALARGLYDGSLTLKDEFETLVSFLLLASGFMAQDKSARDQNKQIFIQEAYPLYKKLCDYDILAVIRKLAKNQNNHDAALLAKRLYHRVLPKVFHITEENVKVAHEMIESFKRKEPAFRDWQLTLLKRPHLSYQMSEDPILLNDKSGHTTYLHDNSLMVRSISDKYESSYLVCVDRELVDHAKARKLMATLSQL